jgi:hypothetical protein
MTPFESSAPFAADPFWANVSAYLRMNGTDGSTSFVDETGKTWTAGGNAQIDTDYYKFGGASGLFDGNGDYVTSAAHADFNFGSGDWTLEWWVRNGAVASDHCIFDNRSASADGVAIYSSLSSGGTACLGIYSSAARLCAGGADDLPVKAWAHMAAVRSGNTLYGFIDGRQVCTGTDTRTYGTGAAPFLGTNYVGTQGYLGSISHFRMTKGVARYTAAFTPPIYPFPGR